MQLIMDNVNKQKILAVSGEKRIFTLEFPSDTTTGELFGVVSEIKNGLWKSLEEEKAKEKKSEEPEVQTENTAKTEAKSDEKKVEEFIEKVLDPK